MIVIGPLPTDPYTVDLIVTKCYYESVEITSPHFASTLFIANCFKSAYVICLSNIPYSRMVGVAGHELTHESSKGRQHDAVENKATCWDDETIEAYTRRTEWLVELYDEFPAENASDVQVECGRRCCGRSGVELSDLALSDLAEVGGGMDKAQYTSGLGAFADE